MKVPKSTSLRLILLASLTASLVSFYSPASLHAAGRGIHRSISNVANSGGDDDGGNDDNGGGNDDGSGHDAGDDHGGGTGGGNDDGSGHDVGDDNGGGNDDGSGHDAGDDHGGTGGGNDDGGNDDGDDHGGGHHEGQNEFLGTIKALPATADLTGTWTVDDFTVVVTADTQIRTEHGTPAVGAKVEVEGIKLADGSIEATRIKTEDHSREREDNVFFGKIEALPASGIIGTWQVSGLTILVNSGTRVESEDAAPALGLTVRVEGVQQTDASIVASEIVVKAANTVPLDNVRHRGVVEQLPATLGSRGNWLVDGVLVTVTDDSKFKGRKRNKLKVGRHAVVIGEEQINGTILARKVKFLKVSR